MTTASCLLQVQQLAAWYGPTQVLYDVNLAIHEGEIVSLIGRNGMGKSSTIRAILGLMPRSEGQLSFQQTDLKGLKPHKIARQGIGWVPEGRYITENLSVRENLLATYYCPLSRRKHNHWQLNRVMELFPRLEGRLSQGGGELSGGEQQMLAIGRALMTNPRLLILDEATEGLAPKVRQAIWQCLLQLKQQGLAILVVDKNIHALCQVADRHVIVEKGCTVWAGHRSSCRAISEFSRDIWECNPVQHLSHNTAWPFCVTGFVGWFGCLARVSSLI